MSTQSDLVEKYLVFQFTNVPASGAVPASETSVCIGEFVDIEEAFTVASKRVYTDLANTKVALRYSDENDKIDQLRVSSTECGYDLLCGFTILSRIWIHVKKLS